MQIRDTAGCNPALRVEEFSPAVVLLALTIALSPHDAAAAELTVTNALPPPVLRTAQQDHQALMKLLNITTLRPGRNGSNPQATNYANYDESKANP